MSHKIIFYSMFCLLTMFMSCNTKSSTKSKKATTQENSKALETAANKELTSAIIPLQVLDTTNYIEDCVYSNLVNGKQGFASLENELISLHILKNKTPTSYKEFHIRYVKPIELGPDGVGNYYINGTDKKYYTNKLVLAGILKKYFATYNYNDINSCFDTASNKENFKTSLFQRFITANEHFFSIFSTENFLQKNPVDSPKDFFKAIDKGFSVELFSNNDMKLANLMLLSKALDHYDATSMEEEYLKVLEIAKQAKTTE